MAQWNLSVDLRSQGNSLGRTLREDARHARTLATAVRSARSEVRSLGQSAQATARQLNGMGQRADAARTRLARLAAQAGRASRDLRHLAAEAQRAERRLNSLNNNVRIRIDLDDRTGTSLATLRSTLADLRANGNIRLDLDFDPTSLTAAAVALRALRSEASDTARTLTLLRTRATALANALDDLRGQALAAAGGLLALNAAARGSDDQLRALSVRTRTLRGDLDDLNGSLGRVGGRMGQTTAGTRAAGNAAGGTSGRMRDLIFAAVALSTALIPIAAATVPIAAGLTAAGVGAGLFGVAIAGQIKSLTEAVEAETKYREAVEEHGARSQEAAEAQLAYSRQMAKMPPATRETAAAVSVLKDQYTEWSDSLADDTMPVATKSMAVLGGMFKQATPFVKGTSREMDRFVTILAGGMQTEGFDRFMDDFAEFSTESLAKANTGLVKLTQSADTGKIGGNVREFMAYAKENGPLVGDTLGNLVQVLTRMLVSASDVGIGVLTVVNAFAQLANAVPTELISVLLQIAIAIKAVKLAAAGLAAVQMSSLAASTALFVRSARFGGVGAAIAGVTQRLTALQKAGIVLATLALIMMGISKLADKARGAPPDVDKLTTSLKNLASTGKFSGELKKTFGDMEGFVDKVELLNKKTKELEETRKGGGTGLGRVPLLDDVSDWISDRLLDMKDGQDGINALKDDFKSFDEAMAGMAGSGYGKQAAQDFALLETALRKSGKSTKEINDLFPKYKDAVAAAAAEQKLAAQAMGIFGAQAQATSTKLDAQKASADGLRQAIIALNETNRAAYDSQIQFEQAIDDLSASFKENGATLDLNSEAGRKNGTAMSQAAKAHDDMVTAGVAAGDSLGSMTSKSDTLRTSMMKLATDAFGGNKKKATEYVNTLLGVPGEIKTLVELERAEAVKGLQDVQAQILKTPGAKSITVSTLNAAAIRALEAVGLKTRTLPDGRTEVYTANGRALGPIGAVLQALNNLNGQTAYTYTVHTTTYVIKGKPGGPPGGTYHGSTAGRSEDGNLYGPAKVRSYADGGTEQHVAQIAQPTFRMWAEPETGGESYIPLAPSKRPRSRAIAEETVRRLGGDPAAIQWYADGGGIDYTHTAPSLYNLSSIAGDSKNKSGKFDPTLFGRKLGSSTRVARAWRKDLATVAARAGQDVADALEAMGTEGIELTRKMATGSSKYTRQMAASLKALAETSKATLGDYTGQLNKTIKDQTAFQNNLVKLAASGNTDLAKALAAQGDQAAADLAAAAVKDPKRARHANTAARQAADALSPEQVRQLVAIIAAVKTSNTGLHDVADVTGLGEDDIIATATKATGQIKSSLGSRAAKFLADLARAQKGLSYANGGIRPGIYSTQAGAVTFAEPETGGEAFIPLGAGKRRVASTVLHDVARRFGVGLTDISSSRQVVVIKEGDTNVTVTAVRTGASASDIGSQVGRGVRRAQRGGVNARA